MRGSGHDFLECQVRSMQQGPTGSARRIADALDGSSPEMGRADRRHVQARNPAWVWAFGRLQVRPEAEDGVIELLAD
jgi:hypothetical protein